MQIFNFLAIFIALFSSSWAFADAKICDYVLLSDFKIIERLGEGGQAHAFNVRYQGKDQVFRYLNSISTDVHGYYPKLSLEQKKKLSEMDSTKSFDFIQELTAYLIKMGISYIDIDIFRRTQYDIAHAILSFHYTNSVGNLQYRGHNIAPEIHSLVKNEDGVVVGQLMEFIEGENLYRLVDAGVLNLVQINEVFRQVIEQIEILDANGFAHGDPSPGNVMVQTLPNQKIIVRLIDFFSTVGNQTSTAESNQKSLRKIEQDRREILQPFISAERRLALLKLIKYKSYNVSNLPSAD